MKTIGVLALAVALAGCGSPHSEQAMKGTKETPMTAGTKPAPRANLPPIDAELPETIETATFATG